MEDPALYRKYAEECKRLASKMSSADRTVMLEIAGAWLECANNTEKTATGKAAEKPKTDDQTPGELLVGEGAPGLSLTGGGGHA